MGGWVGKEGMVPSSAAGRQQAHVAGKQVMRVRGSGRQCGLLLLSSRLSPSHQPSLIPASRPLPLHPHGACDAAHPPHTHLATSCRGRSRAARSTNVMPSSGPARSTSAA